MMASGNAGGGSAEKRTSTAAARQDQENELDEALEDTFPASDPTSLGQETGDEAPAAREDRKTPLLDVELINELASELKQTVKERKPD